jgi:signal transduction histidine kinase
METYAAERQVRLQLTPGDQQLSANNYQLSVDGKAVQQALINLIDNAIKHSPTGETVTVGLQVGGAECGVGSGQATGAPLREAESLITLWVEDHGEGIPAAEQEKILERFYRVGSELRRETQGVGIGLSIVKHVVEAHGGKVVVRSAVGQGSRFTIELPMNNNQETKRQGSEG